MTTAVIAHHVVGQPDGDDGFDSVTVVRTRRLQVWTFIDFVDPGLGYFIDPEGATWPSYTHDATPPAGIDPEAYHAYTQYLEDTYA